MQSCEVMLHLDGYGVYRPSALTVLLRLLPRRDFWIVPVLPTIRPEHRLYIPMAPFLVSAWSSSDYAETGGEDGIPAMFTAANGKKWTGYFALRQSKFCPLLFTDPIMFASEIGKTRTSSFRPRRIPPPAKRKRPDFSGLFICKFGSFKHILVAIQGDTHDERSVGLSENRPCNRIASPPAHSGQLGAIKVLLPQVFS